MNLLRVISNSILCFAVAALAACGPGGTTADNGSDGSSSSSSSSSSSGGAGLTNTITNTTTHTGGAGEYKLTFSSTITISGDPTFTYKVRGELPLDKGVSPVAPLVPDPNYNPDDYVYFTEKEGTLEYVSISPNPTYVGDCTLQIAGQGAPFKVIDGAFKLSSADPVLDYLQIEVPPLGPAEIHTVICPEITQVFGGIHEWFAGFVLLNNGSAPTIKDWVRGSGPSWTKEYQRNISDGGIAITENTLLKIE